MEKYIGLTSIEAKRRNEKGLNQIEKKKMINPLLTFLFSFKDPGIILLLIASVISFSLNEKIDGLIIVFVVFLNSFISTIQEIKTSKALESLKSMTSLKSKVLRDNEIKEIDSIYICVDDIVFLQEGDVVPCDLVIVGEEYVNVDESILTGESFPISKNKGDELFSSTSIVSGKAFGRCIAIGKNTKFGKIASLIDKKKEETLLQKKMNKLSKWLSIFSLFIVFLMLLISFLRGNQSKEMLILSISLAVAAIPEGLVAIVTLVLALSVKELVDKKVLVRNMHSVETLGSINIVCSDKTGTITKNKLELKKINTYGNDKIMIVALNSALEVKEGNKDPLEKAIYHYLEDKNALININKKKIIPFSSEKKIMSTIIKYDNEEYLFSKGASENILSLCSFYALNGKVYPLSHEQIKRINKDIIEEERKGYRLISYSYELNDKRIYLGYISFFDEPKEGIEESIKKMKNIGINVKMITGDSLNTAFECAKKVGITDCIEECIEEKNLKISNIDNCSVFARSSPETKMEIINYYQEKKECVLMTGDGVNDSPSLKKADVGIAMGLRGSEVAKESADIVILDDDFSTIEVAIEEGRNIYYNIKKSILFLLSSNLGEVLSMFIFLVLNLPSPLISIHILWVNLISDSLPSLALGRDKKYDDIMEGKIRKKDESFFSNGGIKIIVVYGLMIAFLTSLSFLLLPIMNILRNGEGINLATISKYLSNEAILIKSRTLAFTTLSFSQLYHMYGMSNVRKKFTHIFKNRNSLMKIAFILGISLQALVICIPYFSMIFRVCSLSIFEWIYVLLISSTPLIVHEFLINSYPVNL